MSNATLHRATERDICREDTLGAAQPAPGGLHRCWGCWEVCGVATAITKEGGTRHCGDLLPPVLRDCRWLSPLNGGLAVVYF